MDRKKIRKALLNMARERGADKTFCPSEVARALQGDGWRDLMDAIRHEGKKLTEAGKLTATQKGEPVDATEAKGPIRFRKAD